MHLQRDRDSVVQVDGLKRCSRFTQAQQFQRKRQIRGQAQPQIGA